MTQARPVGLPSHGQRTPAKRPPGQKRAPKFEGLKDDELTRPSMCIWEMNQNFNCITYMQTDKTSGPVIHFNYFIKAELLN